MYDSFIVIVAISANVFNSSQVDQQSLKFPVPDDILNFTIQYIPVISNVPMEVINRIEKLDKSSELVKVIKCRQVTECNLYY